jgi:type IV pilus assembly protein PilM
VNFSFGFLTPKVSMRPRLACEIMPEGVVAGRQAEVPVMAFVPLSEGMVKPGLSAPNFADPALVATAVKKALDELDSREKPLTLVVPDATVRVLMMDFDSLPSKLTEALPLVRFRLRKLTPFDVDDAAISYQVMSQQAGQTRVLVTVMPAAVRAEYEGAVRDAGYEPGVILSSTLASLAVLGGGSQTGDEPALVVNRNGLSVTTAITRGNELLLYRTLELPQNDEAGEYEELVQTVSVATAYFEDALHTLPTALYYVGPGGAQEFLRTLGPAAEGSNLHLRDLVSNAASTMTALPKGFTAGVTGALAN